MLRIMRYLSKAEIGQMLIALVSIIGQIWLDLTLPDYCPTSPNLLKLRAAACPTSGWPAAKCSPSHWDPRPAPS
mgnify:CR=1 FL=1